MVLADLLACLQRPRRLHMLIALLNALLVSLPRIQQDVHKVCMSISEL
jgi:hypothetical protein